ncbi:MAG TPA: LutB/LldF family L-lactate oxidation iron-sulfur protein [Anaerolineales bacterium]|nr:LutB/LldF family L-lactate oxidation iron-sulfur protein [Anaerolineales bacterium]
MRRDFARRVRRAIANPTLQSALDHSAWRRVEARQEAFRSLPDADSLQAEARAIRMRTVAELEDYVQLFSRRLASNGIQVHRAASAEEACRLVISIARVHRAALIAKSKSMVSEEIGLNHALQAAGIEVVETDLGEFIVQLRGETPSHIISPAVHLRREDVAQTFQQALGMPYSTDVEAMTAFARRTLRGVFLSASIGLSGVNFGVAETGTLCIVTNEGNGRMVTSIPPVHIALMGVERIVPELEHLALMLQLLPRSATGQKLTSYVSLIQAPRRLGDLDGPDERHVILLDNGRFDLVGTPLEESLLCIRCGACLNACPVYREIGGHAYGSVYPGPIGSVLSPALFGVAEYGHLAKASTLCGACRDACPVQIDLPTLLLRTRVEYTRTVVQPQWLRVGLRLYTWIAERPDRYRSALRVAALISRLLPLRGNWIRALPPPFSAWTRFRHFPPFARRPFRARFTSRPPVTPRRGILPAPDGVPARNIAAATSAQDLFAQQLRGVGGELVPCQTGQLPDLISSRLGAARVDRLLAWGANEPLLAPTLERLRREGVTILEGEIPRGGGSLREASLNRLAEAQAGLTGALAGLADTGTLVLAAGENRSQLASLLPPIHLAVLPAGQIFASLQRWIVATKKEPVIGASAVSLISGPSRTADIEMTLTTGVHGPGRLIVFLVQDA